MISIHLKGFNKPTHPHPHKHTEYLWVNLGVQETYRYQDFRGLIPSKNMQIEDSRTHSIDDRVSYNQRETADFF
jgi:hypothetical protein